MKFLSKVHGFEYKGKTYSFEAVVDVAKEEEEVFKKDSRFVMIGTAEEKKHFESEKIIRVGANVVETKKKVEEITRALDESNKPKKIKKPE